MILNEKMIRSFARSVLFEQIEHIDETFQPDNFYSGGRKNLNTGMFDQPGPDHSKDEKELYDELEKEYPNITYVSSNINFVEPVSDLNHVYDENYSPTSVKDLSQSTSILIQNTLDMTSTSNVLDDTWKKIKKIINTQSGNKI